MDLSDQHERVLRALAEGLVLKAHRTMDGDKVYRLHALDGSAIGEVDPATMADLKAWKLIDSNKKFPAASYLLTEKGRELVASLITGERVIPLGASSYVQRLSSPVPKLRVHGKPPFGVAVIHGGPGAPGQVAPVARELSASQGVLEPFQAAASLDGQVQELKAVLEEHGSLPIRLVGWSWGAVLSFVLAARYPQLVTKLILVSSAVFDEAYAAQIAATRLSRLSEEGRRAADSLMGILDDPAAPTSDKNAALARLAGLFTRVDACDPLTLDMEVLEVRHDINQSVWNEARKLRMSGELLELGRRIECPVVAIHGDYDPHPAEGVRVPLSPVLRDFRFFLLKGCGHTPWIERRVRQEFFEMLKRELG